MEGEGADIAAETAVAEEAAPEATEEAEAPVEEVAVGDAPVGEEVVGGSAEEVESGGQSPKFTPFYDDEQAEDGSLKVSEHSESR